MSKSFKLLLAPMVLGAPLLAACGGSGDSFLGDFELPAFGSDEETERQLELPPDLDAPVPTEDYRMPDRKAAAMVTSSVLPERLDMRLHREGDVVWLAVGADPLSLWTSLRSFYESRGFVIAEANPVHGYLQTNWRERRMQLTGSAAIRVRDQFRLHIERSPKALTNIYVANRSGSYYNGEWRLNAPDRDAEWAMLQSLRDYLGSLSEGRARSRTLEAASVSLDVLDLDGVPVLSIGQTYSRVWRRLSVALNRAGWDVVGSDRSRGIYYARLADRSHQNADGASLRPGPEAAQLHLLEAGGKTLITAHSAQKNRRLAYEEAYDVLRYVVNAYSVYDD